MAVILIAKPVSTIVTKTHAMTFSSRLKEKFANNSANLLVVDDGLKQQKEAQAPDQWLPPNQVYRCEYLANRKKRLDYYSDLNMTPASY